jgi:hypothetical protein
MMGRRSRSTPRRTGDNRGLADPVARQEFVQVFDAGRGLRAIECDAGCRPRAAPQSGAGGRTVGIESDDEHTRVLVKPVRVDQLAQQRHRLSGHADEAAADPAILDQPAGDPARDVAGDREADALGGTDDGRVDADDGTVGVEQRPPGVAWVERGVGLDDVINQTSRTRAERSAQATDDAGGGGLLETHRAADGDGDLAGTNPPAVGERQVADVVGLSAKHGEIRVGIVADEIGGKAPAVRECDGQAAGAVYHMAVGQEVAIRGDEEPRAAAALGLRAGLDVDHGLAGPVDGGADCPRVAVKQGTVPISFGKGSPVEDSAGADRSLRN